MKTPRACFGVIVLLQIFAVQAFAQPDPAIYTNWQPGFTNSLKGTHNMALPAWGPYSDKYNGISHIPAQNNGFRFDIAVQPSLYLRNLTPLANVKRESGYHPWQASANLSYFSYRYELEWKDKVFCDVSFSKVDDNSRLIRAEFVNNTGSNRSIALNIFNTIIFPYSKNIKAVLPDGAEWIKAADYVSLTDSVHAYNYNLVYNGQLRGQVRDDDAVSHTAIVIGRNKGENVLYRFNNQQPGNAAVILRYKTANGADAKLRAKINGKLVKTIDLKGSKDYASINLNTGDIPKGELTLSFSVANNATVTLDGFVLTTEKEASKIVFKEEKLNPIAKQFPAGIPNAIVLKYDDVKEFYGIIWSDTNADERELFDDDADQALFIFNNLTKAGKEAKRPIKINGNNKGWFKNVFFAPIFLKPKQKAVKYAYVVWGNSAGEVIAKLKQLNTQWSNAERIYQQQPALVSYDADNKAGIPYRFSQQLMAATTLTNLIYPTFTANQFTKHTTPGKKWSSLYTWDSGFIGLGYLAINNGRALESLNAYTMDADEQSAFLEHGTPLPVQGYLFNELWNKTQNTEYLKYYYPRLKRFYDFLGGAESSPTRKLKSNFIKTWDIFYNSGGWDDYCPQEYVHKEKLEKWVAPTVNTSHQIRFAKMLKMAAWQLGYQDDIKQYDVDINLYSKALQQYSWDDASGYYGYVKHDDAGNATEILRHASGQNFNKGIDGCSPLIAGISTPVQQQKMLKHLFTKGELWTDQGITAIDQTAPYYYKDGYWNGRVWIAHQWFFWKTMLDLNEPEKAIHIAQTALNVWKRETEDTYNCWENFSVETGNGGGWHQFGALSSPVLNWYSSLFKPGTITHGFNVWPVAQQFNSTNSGFKGRFKLFADQYAQGAAILLCLSDIYNYEAKCNGKSIPLKKALNGLYIVNIGVKEAGTGTFSIEITKKNK